MKRPDMRAVSSRYGYRNGERVKPGSIFLPGFDGYPGHPIYTLHGTSKARLLGKENMVSAPTH